MTKDGDLIRRLILSERDGYSEALLHVLALAVDTDRYAWVQVSGRNATWYVAATSDGGEDTSDAGCVKARAIAETLTALGLPSTHHRQTDGRGEAWWEVRIKAPL